ncbi:tyrosine-type recombinase/integrase [Brevifollis gellanilyticus]|uniref:Tyr recombinase domain-containing protein n=1 Tax=Brevifollis gellanilyticus TaxID=748831 RepID=A0A512MAY3_9BACT|nr:site-specific integrase [Brevifollis gellanilyticus]GEP43892.1 hypothetical protein BGE01nite_31830 [Brevifollis gellanilyticus]
MKTGGNRDQKGVWQRVAPCLFRYRESGYYAVVRRSGKIVRKSLETDRLEVAKRKLRDFQNEVEKVGVDAHSRKFGEVIEDFVSSRTGAPATLGRYSDIAKRIKTSWPEGVKQYVRNVDLRQCSTWLKQFNDQVASYNLARQWLVMFFNYCIGNNYITRPPFDRMTLKPKKRIKPIRNAPSEEEFNAIINAIREQPFTDHAQDTGDLVEFMGLAGVGQAECAGLRWQHVSLSTDKLTLFRVKTKTAYTIPLYPKVRPLIERLKELAVDADPSATIFKVRDPKKALAAACRRLSFPDFSPRSLRRMFIIRAIEKGVPIKTIAEWQGHVDGGVLILSAYSNIINGKTNAEAAKLLA